MYATWPKAKTSGAGRKKQKSGSSSSENDGKASGSAAGTKDAASHANQAGVRQNGASSSHLDNGDEAADAGDEEREELVIKLLSQDPGNYQDAPREGVRRVLEQILGIKIDRKEKFSTQKIGTIRLVLAGITLAHMAECTRAGAYRYHHASVRGQADSLFLIP